MSALEQALGKDAVTIGELREAHRRDFWASLERQAEQSVRRAEVCRGWDPVARRTTGEARAELALIPATRPAVVKETGK